MICANAIFYIQRVTWRKCTQSFCPGSNAICLDCLFACRRRWACVDGLSSIMTHAQRMTDRLAVKEPETKDR